MDQRKRPSAKEKEAKDKQFIEEYALKVQKLILEGPYESRFSMSLLALRLEGVSTGFLDLLNRPLEGTDEEDTDDRKSLEEHFRVFLLCHMVDIYQRWPELFLEMAEMAKKMESIDQ